MKKIIYLVLAAAIVTAMLSGCARGGNTAPTKDSDTVITWSDSKADPDVVGAWQLDDADQPEYYLFTEDCKYKIAKGSEMFSADLTYGEDKLGNRSLYCAYTSFYGQFTYTVTADTLTIKDAEGTTTVLHKAEYTPSETPVFDDFKADSNLIGYWFNSEYSDAYSFSSDGTVKYTADYGDQGYSAICTYVYKPVNGEKIVFRFSDGTGNTQEHTSTYSIDGDILKVDGNEYTRTQPSE